jgi:hypothetical protein
MTGPRKHAGNTRGKPFEPGNPGRPAGSRNRVTLAIDELLDGEAEKLTRAAITMALGGDVTAMRLCLDRLAPARKDRPITFALPKLETGADAKEAVAALIQAVAARELTPSEAGDVSRLIDGFSGIPKVTNIEARLDALERERNPA